MRLVCSFTNYKLKPSCLKSLLIRRETLCFASFSNSSQCLGQLRQTIRYWY